MSRTSSPALLSAALVAAIAVAQSACVAETASGGGGPTTVTTTTVAAPAVATAAPAGGEVRLAAGLESAYVLQGSDGQTYMVVDLAAAAAPVQTVRPAMAVALVVDRSGSMAGDKIANARAAAQSFIQSMADGDVVSIFQYDDTIEMVAQPTVVGPDTRPALTAAIGMITPRGSTNLYGGLVAGIESLTSALAERPVRRVILISDGLANVGPSSPMELGNVAATAAARGISVTSIGVGLDYDESVMGTVAVRSGGRFYHLQEPAQLVAILDTELNALGATVARAVTLELQPTPGVVILGATGAALTRQGETVVLSVGDMLGEQSRQVVIPVQVPTSGSAEQVAARLTLRYRAAAGDQERSSETAVSYQLARSEADVTRGVRPELAVAVERHRTVEARVEAAQLVASGEADRAADVLATRAAESRARGHALGGRAAAAIDAEASSVESRASRVRAARSAPAARAEQLDLADEALEAQGF